MPERTLGSFYAHIDGNKRKSVLLVLVFIAVVGGLGWLIGEVWIGQGIGFLGIFGAVAIIWSLAAYFAGDRMVLAVSRAREIRKSDDPELWNVIEELCLAGGMPMPKVYLIEDTAPNAFATGRDPEHGVVAITTGLRQKLDRDELAGVMAHELSHIRFYDIRLQTLIGVLVGLTALISDMFLRSMWWGGGRRGRSSRSSGSGGGTGAILVVVAILAAVVAPLFARLLQLSISRKREYLADAGAVQLTRYPDGLARALEKISGDQEVLEAANRATQHLYIVNPIKSFEKRARGLFSTHPPLEERVDRLRSM
ncbi:MAG: M48 family metallopeptidase [bacterium]